MKLTANTKELSKMLAECVAFAPAKPLVRILKFAKITTKGNRLKIESNNQEAGIVKYMDVVECDQDGTSLIDVAEFSKFISKINSETVQIAVNGDTVSVKHPKGKADFVTASAEEYPSFKMNDDDSVEFTLPSSLLANVIDKGMRFVSADVLRSQMTAIYTYIEGGKFGFCATDTHKLAYGEIETDISGDVSWLIMPFAFSALLKACAENNEIFIKTNDKKTLYRFGNTQIVTSQANGKYPNFKRVIPQSFTMECDIEKDDVLDALKRVILFCDNTGCVKMGISQMDMNISVDNIDSAKKTVENITHSGCTGDIEIGISATNLIACVNALKAGEITIKMTDASRPIVFEHKDNPNFITLSMPMQLTGA